MSRTILLGALAIGVFALIGGFTGSALFTDQETIDANDFNTQDIDISTAPATALVAMSGMIPGDSVTGAVVVSNDGDLDLRYAISSSATNADTLGLKDALTLTINTIDATTPGIPCDDFDGTQLYTGDLDSTAGVLVGDPAQGDDAGDRALATSASETLCFRVELSGSSSGPDGASTSATFSFDAEQTVNNP